MTTMPLEGRHGIQDGQSESPNFLVAEFQKGDVVKGPIRFFSGIRLWILGEGSFCSPRLRRSRGSKSGLLASEKQMQAELRLVQSSCPDNSFPAPGYSHAWRQLPHRTPQFYEPFWLKYLG